MAILSTMALFSLSVYIGLAYWGRSAILYSTALRVAPSWRSRIFLSLAAIGFVTCLFQGARAMLFWVPSTWGSVDENGQYQTLATILAALFAFAGLFFIAFIDGATHEKVWLRVTREHLQGLSEILQASLDRRTLADLKEKYEKKAAELAADLGPLPAGRSDDDMVRHRMGPTGERIAVLQALADTAQKQHQRLEHAVDSAINDERRRQQQALEHQATERQSAQRALEEAESAQRRSSKLREVTELIRVACDKRSYLPCSSSTSLQEDGTYVLDARMVTKQWSTMSGAAAALLGLTDQAIANGKVAPHSIQTLLDSLPGVTVPVGCTILAAYTGTAHGGRTEVFVECSGTKQSLDSALKLDSSVASLMSGFFATFGLPTFGIFWHGLYDYDYDFLFSDDDLLTAIGRQVGSSSVDLDLSTLDRPTGLRVHKAGDVCRVSCLAAFPNGSVVDLDVRFESGRIVGQTKEELVKSSTRVLY
ncbi:MAG: hypothetical protein ACRD96_05325 [Bryobacteraceae bacterium]